MKVFTSQFRKKAFERLVSNRDREAYDSHPLIENECQNTYRIWRQVSGEVDLRPFFKAYRRTLLFENGHQFGLQSGVPAQIAHSYRVSQRFLEPGI